MTKNGRGAESLMETMTKGRVYAHVEGDDVKSVVYFDTKGRRSKQIDLSHAHGGKRPHTHHGYEFPKGEHLATGLTRKEAEMVERVLRLWNTRRGE